MARAAFALTKEVFYTTLNFLLNKENHECATRFAEWRTPLGSY